MARVKRVEAKPITDVWVMAYVGSTLAGSYSSVSSGDKFYLSFEDCSKAIDDMFTRPWPGMGDRSRYRPIHLISATKETE